MPDSTSVKSLIGDVKRKWLALGVPIRPGASIERIRLLEEKLNRKLPEPFVTWLRETGGMDYGEWDDETMRFWQIDEIEEQDPGFGMERWKGSSFVVFFDFLISSHFYAVDVADENGSVWQIAGKGEPMSIAPSFEHFLREYLRDTMSMFREA